MGLYGILNGSIFSFRKVTSNCAHILAAAVHIVQYDIESKTNSESDDHLGCSHTVSRKTIESSLEMKTPET